MKESHSAINVLIIDDHIIMRGGLRLVLESAGINVIAEAGTGQDGIKATQANCPDVVLLDVGLPDCSGLDVLRSIKKLCPQSRVLMLTHQDDPTFLSRAVAAGAAGYLLKLVTPAQLTEAIQAVAKGEVRVDSNLLQQATRQWTTAALQATS